MELKCTNPNGEIILSIKLNHMDFFLKNCNNCIQKWILQVIFSRRCLDCAKKKIVHNFHITYSNKKNQSFPCWQKYNLWEKNILKKKNLIKTFFATWSPLFWAYFNISFVPGHQLGKKWYSHKANFFFLAFKKNFKKS